MCRLEELQPSAAVRGIIPDTLEHHDCGGADAAAGGRRYEVTHQPVDEAADLAVKPLVVSEEDAEDLGQREHELLVRQPPPQLLVHVLAQQEGQRWKTLQLKGRKYAARQSGLVQRMQATPLL